MEGGTTLLPTSSSGSPLRDYLARHFPADRWVEEGQKPAQTWTDRDLMEHFFTLYGVSVITEGSLFYQFKYQMCLTESWNEEVKEARGIIFERRGPASPGTGLACLALTTTTVPLLTAVMVTMVIMMMLVMMVTLLVMTMGHDC